MMRHYHLDSESLSEYAGERLTKTEERAKSNSKRLDRLERLADEVSKQNENIARLVIQLEYMNRQLSAQEKRLREIESEPRNRMQMIAGAIVTALCSALIGGVVGLLL